MSTSPEEKLNGYDYHNQAWVVHGKYVACGHPRAMLCECYGTINADKPVAENARIA